MLNSKRYYKYTANTHKIHFFKNNTDFSCYKQYRYIYLQNIIRIKKRID